MQMLLTLLILYVLLALFVMLVQRRLIYLPTKLSPDMASQLAREEGFQPWHNPSGELMGWHLPAKSSPNGSVLIVHGNAGSALHRGYLAQPIHGAAAVDVFVLEYPGYGGRAGSPGMPDLLAAAEHAFAALPTNRPVYVVAESIGSGVAAHLAKIHGGRIAGLLFFAPYDDLAGVGQNQMPFLPVKLLLRDRFRPAEWLKDYRGPAKFVLAEADTIIPMKFGRKLFDGYRGPKEIEVVPGAGHNDIAGQSAAWWREVFAFWQKDRPRDG
jgi:pimeloyl-ACP methyl ester carboxylesterase